MIINPPAISEIKKQIDNYLSDTKRNPNETLKGLEELRDDIEIKINICHGFDILRNK